MQIRPTAIFWAIVGSILFWALLIGIVRADEIDDNLISAIIQVESGGNPNAVSSQGAIGLMQITQIVFEEWDIEKSDFANSCAWNPPCRLCKKPIIDLYNPKDNIRVGTWYLSRLKYYYLKENYTIERLLAAYNGGITRLKKCNYDVSKMPKETREYVKKIMKLYKVR